MTRWFADASIRRKLTMLMALSTTVVLVVAAVALGFYEVAMFRRALVQKIITVADVVGRNSTAALAFGDRTAARDVLAAFEAEPAIEQGVIFDASGHVFATYAAGRRLQPLPSAPGPQGTRFEGSRLVLVGPIVLDGEPVGSLYIQAGMQELTDRMTVFVAVTVGVMAACSLLAFVLSALLQRRVSGPILDLAQTARQVTSARNFSIRAPFAGADEVGLLVQDFNRMLGEIEHQDQRLRDQQEQLTVQVAHRTAELVAANDQLRSSVQRVERYAAQIAQLTALGQLLQSCRSDDEVFGVVAHAMQKLFPEGAGALSLLKSDNHLMETVTVWGEHPPVQRVFDADDCWAFRRGRPHVVDGFESPVRCGHLTGVDGPVTYCVPMVAQGDTVGLLQFNFDPADEPDVVDDDGAVHSTRGRLVVALAEHVATSLSNLRLREALRSQSIVDALTGLFNRRYLTDVLERECRRAIRSSRSLAVLMLDVDHFKRFNDTWGHDGGDIVLRELAAVLRAAFRGDDFACRYGGEEFVVLLAEASMDSAYARAEQLRLMVHRLSAELRGQPMGAVTVSIGIALLPGHGMTPEELIASADRALYEAKTRGRDCTVRAPMPRLSSTHSAD